MKIQIFLFFIISFFYSCKKHEGRGGKHSISGTVVGRKYSLSSHTYTSPAYNVQDVDVYIIYGDNLAYGDHQKTTPDGTYEFKYLHKGHYKVYAYSKDSTNASPTGKNAEAKDVTIGSEKNITIPQIDILQ
jgi:hypothetical protein